MKYLLYVVSTLFLIPSCHKGNQNTDSGSSVEYVDNEIWNPIIILTRKENKVVEATADKLYKNNNEDALLVGRVKADFFDDNGFHSSILYSDSARINEASKNLKANGNVYVVSDSGYTLTTNEILWDNNYKMIVAEDSVMFTTSDGDTLYGVGFESDMDLEQWRISRPFGIAREGI
ncbi:MAG: LPS export ABC transporter periplasmic protein LptC [Candidatus Marinimicrobia bacterium]|jgi:LPS export ABC transporter protein LptC|nr:LPS export ABC transporter periplasmic protein LptC [Candidatus Neomarinimicrobiota bacterium]MDP6853422.1 LPS export ABC transporter periplasmic protein LptC [Candidatus Neomarinimicrobiota bacterium]MDP6936747.1 LPS export ABC transporter periplasmic protein LptC [Candidatus Neomarinimicrobiota bacterium]